MIYTGSESATWFEECLEIILEWEGHDKITDDSDDAGGLTRWGITQYTLAAWKGIPSADITLGHMKNLTKSEATEIYCLNYFEKMGCQEFTCPVALCVFDTAVNIGPPKAARMLQSLVGAKQDGDVGPLTIKAINDANEKELLLNLMGKRALYYVTRPSFKQHGFGWFRRVLDVHSQAVLRR